jgi:hypothetical protein
MASTVQGVKVSVPPSTFGPSDLTGVRWSSSSRDRRIPFFLSDPTPESTLHARSHARTAARRKGW